jgi:arylsulfatase A
MKKIRLYGVAMVIVLLMIIFAWKVKGKWTQQTPNIIYIYADDLGYGDIGIYGQQYIKTPNIDKLGREGIMFTQHYTGAPICAPARCILMTGKHSGNSWVRDNMELKHDDFYQTGQLPLPEEEETIGEMLKRAGYATAIIGKWGLGSLASSGAPNKQGFDLFYGYADQVHAHNHYPTFLWRNDTMEPLKNDSFRIHQRFEGTDPNNPREYDKYKGTEHTMDLFTKEAKNFIRQNKGKPFFIYLAHIVPHKALQVPEESLRMYDDIFDEQPYPGGQGYTPHYRPLSAYAAMISRMDEQIGEIIDLLKELKIDRNTLVMFSSDNGPASGGGLDPKFFQSSGGLRGLKGQVYEGGIRVPFVAWWPGKINKGTVTDHISAQYDLKATLADITGQEKGYTDGISFYPVLLGNDDRQKKHEYLYWEFPGQGGQYAVRMDKWKGVHRSPVRGGPARWEIYNLDEDWAEVNDLAENHPELVKKFDGIVNQRTPSHIPRWNFSANSRTDSN